MTVARLAGLRTLILGALLLGTTACVAGTKSDIASIRSAVDQHNDIHGPTMLREFREFLSLPNVSTIHDDMVINAEWIEQYIAQRGFRSKIVTAGRAPYVIASRHIDDSAPTLLIYAHFDGQPVEASNWSSPPFSPTLKANGAVLDWDKALAGKLNPEWRVYARSAGDDKAPVVTLMHAIDALDNAGIPVKVNIKLILDGEEEVGSPTVEAILAKHAKELDADLMLFCDGPMHQSRKRQLVFGVRGSATVHLTAYGANRPLHSGHYGNWAPHPTDTLMRLLTSMKDEDGVITVPGYYDDVATPGKAEKAAIAAMPEIEKSLRDELALGRVEGANRRLEELVMQPAIIVKGFQGGGVGSQSRNIILPSATASLNLRLVPNQTPAGVRESLDRYFRSQGFYLTDTEPSDEIRRKHEKVLKVDWPDSAYPAFRSRLDSPEARQLAQIVTALDGEPPLLTPTLGGSLPIYLFDQALDMPIVILPVANHDNNQHGRDENMRLKNLFDAVAVYAAVIAQFR